MTCDVTTPKPLSVSGKFHREEPAKLSGKKGSSKQMPYELSFKNCLLVGKNGELFTFFLLNHNKKQYNATIWQTLTNHRTLISPHLFSQAPQNSPNSSKTRTATFKHMHSGCFSPIACNPHRKTYGSSEDLFLSCHAQWQPRSPNVFLISLIEMSLKHEPRSNPQKVIWIRYHSCWFPRHDILHDENQLVKGL